MNEFLDRISKLSPKRLALLALEQHDQIAAMQQREREPVAVVGMACRFPGGADDPEAFWHLLRSGHDAIGEIPADRWSNADYFDPDPDAAGRIAVRHGAFLSGIDRFDAAFFGISPREAVTMDPQQRILLEVAWLALEDAGIATERLAGSATGVFVGICNSDYVHRVLRRGPQSIDAYMASGSAHSVAAGRISYCLGLQGPALSIDTACSSSLVALHQACRSLRAGESRLALAAGVNVICAPETMIALSRAHMLAPDGRCKTFDSRADGFSRGEGCGVLVLKRLSDALSDGDRILAVIRGSAVNQDGRSTGLTVPNGPSQEAVIRAALADGRVDPAAVDYVEAHGTGTALGDPIEVRALANSIAAGRPSDRPLLIGSVKTNFGHLESAAGIAGVIKVILALNNEEIPRHLHFTEPSPHIDWQLAPIGVTAESRPWRRGERPRIAGVSSFGFSGTNAHVIIEEPPPKATASGDSPLRLRRCLPLSARSAGALRELGMRYAELAARPDFSFDATATQAGVARSHLPLRAAVVAEEAGTARLALEALARSETHPALHVGPSDPAPALEVVFLFTGQGSQYPAMSRQLYDSAPRFRQTIDQCNALLGRGADGRTLLEVLFGGVATDAAIHDTVWTQPALFAVEYALAELWRSWGVEPAAVIGHSAGEYVAACVAGVFSLEDGLRLIAQRGRLMQSLPDGGAMAALFAPADVVESRLAAVSPDVAIAAMNAPDSVVISGDAAAVDQVLREFSAMNIEGRRLLVSLGAHSSRVDPILAEMEALAGGTPMQRPRIPVAWNLTGGEPLPGGAPDAMYWRRHMREPVRFAAGISRLHAEGFRTFLEVGPHPTLIALAQRCVPEDGCLFLTSLRRGKEDWAELIESIASLYVRGAAINWEAVGYPGARRATPLPGYPFDRTSYWLDLVERPVPPASAPVGGFAMALARVAAPMPIFESAIMPDSLSGLSDHCVFGAVLVAGPVFMELAQSACAQLDGRTNRSIEDFRIREPLVLPMSGRRVQVHLDEVAAGARVFRIYSTPMADPGRWILHASGRLRGEHTEPAARAIERLPSFSDDASGAADEFYSRLASIGIELGGGFRSIVRARRAPGTSEVELCLPGSARGEAVAWAHPSLVDGALQAIGLATPSIDGDDSPYLLTGVDCVKLSTPLPERVWCRARILNSDDRSPVSWEAEVALFGADGASLGQMTGVRLQRASRDALLRASGRVAGEGLFYELAWDAAPTTIGAASRLKSPLEFAALSRRKFETMATKHGLAIYDDLLPVLDGLAVGFIARALRDLGFDDAVGRKFDASAEARSLGVAARYGRLFDRMLRILAEDGIFGVLGSNFQVLRKMPLPDPPARREDLLRRFGDTDAELRMLERCGSSLSRVLTGEQDPLQLLFPGGSFNEARKLYVDSPYAQTFNRTLAATLRESISSLGEGAKLRILEIGAGTGGTTSFVLPVLAADKVEYVFTDVSPAFLASADETFRDHPYLRRALLDIERDPLEQGFEAASFDIVIAANVLHATADLRSTLKRVRSLIAPHGQLFLLEGVAPERWVDLTFGLTEGWWHFSDRELRPTYPLIARESWTSVLRESGFEAVVSVPGSAGNSRAAVQQAMIVAALPARRREWVIVGDDTGVGAALARRIRAAGDVATVVQADAAAAQFPRGAGLVYLATAVLPSSSHFEPLGASNACLSCFERPLEWLRAAAQRDGRCWLVTRGAQKTSALDAPPDPSQAMLWGLGRVFALEHPGAWGGLIDLEGEFADASAQQVFASLHSIDVEEQVAWRSGARLAARLVRGMPPRGPAFAPSPNATYLVTGGFGGLGLAVAEWLATRGARRIALLGRHGPSDPEVVRKLETGGVEVVDVRGDVADEAFMRDAIARLNRDDVPLKGIFHSAAALSMAPILDLDDARIAEMFHPKVVGTEVLERVTRDTGLDFLVLFSTTTALLGASGLAHYAAANAFMDAFAVANDGPSRRVMSVNWGTWEVMRLVDEQTRRRYMEGGLLPMPTVDALAALGGLLAEPRPNAVVASVDWRVLKSLHEVRRARPLLARLGVERDSRAVAPAPSTVDLPARLATLPAAMREDALIEFVQQEVAAVLGLGTASGVPLTTGLFDLGMDSLMAVELRRRLERGARLSLPSTLTFNYPNVAALVRFLDSQLAGSVAASSLHVPIGNATGEPRHEPAANLPDLDDMGEEELEALLLARLEKTK